MDHQLPPAHMHETCMQEDHMDMDVDESIQEECDASSKKHELTIIPTPMDVVIKKRRVDHSIYFNIPYNNTNNNNTINTTTISTTYTNKKMVHNHLLTLPTEMLAHILSFLSLADLCRSEEMCTSIHTLVRYYMRGVCSFPSLHSIINYTKGNFLPVYKTCLVS